jgi:hypothetical protein
MRLFAIVLFFWCFEIRSCKTGRPPACPAFACLTKGGNSCIWPLILWFLTTRMWMWIMVRSVWPAAAGCCKLFIILIKLPRHVSAVHCHLQEVIHVPRKLLQYCLRLGWMWVMDRSVWPSDLRSLCTTSLNTTHPSTIFYRLLLNWASIRSH